MVDPPDGRIPPLSTEGEARIAAQLGSPSLPIFVLSLTSSSVSRPESILTR